MDLKNILREIEQADAEVFEKLSGRRQVLKSFGGKVAVAALPLALGSMFKKAYGKSTDTVVATLNFLLELEYFEYNYFHTGMSTGSNSTTYLIPVADRGGFQQVEDQDQAHINFLRTTIATLGSTPFTPKFYTGDPVTGNPYSPASYDFTAHSAYPVFSQYASFLVVGQAFKDTAVRAYQGQLPNLLANTNSILTQALQINSVEARHASFIRLLRRFYNLAPYDQAIKPWITDNIPASIPLQPHYLGEDNTIQKGIDITSLPGVTGTLSHTAATEAFDEPLDKATVTNLLASFKL